MGSNLSLKHLSLNIADKEDLIIFLVSPASLHFFSFCRSKGIQTFSIIFIVPSPFGHFFNHLEGGLVLGVVTFKQSSHKEKLGVK